MKLEEENEKPKFNFEEFLDKHKVPLTLGLVGLILIGLGILFFRNDMFGDSGKVEVLEVGSGGEGETSKIVVEIAGAVERPGIYEFAKGDRVEDLLIASGGVSGDADREWIAKFVNQAAKLTDGQKLYIPQVNEISDLTNKQSSGASANNFDTSEGVLGSVENVVNINTSTQKELEDLWGIGPVTAQNIIEQRPYSNTEELQSKKVIKSNVYERIKDEITVF